jgi:hypothetical protein
MAGVILFVAGAIVLAAGLLFYWGSSKGSGDSPPTIPRPTGTDSNDCRQACSAWDNARQMLCAAKADEAAARSRADGIRGQVAAATASAVSLGVGGAAAAAAATTATATFYGIPAGVVLWGIAIALFIASAAAWAAVAQLAGQLTAAEADVGVKASTRQSWDKAVVDARAAVNSLCTEAEANACLSRTAAC